MKLVKSGFNDVPLNMYAANYGTYVGTMCTQSHSQKLFSFTVCNNNKDRLSLTQSLAHLWQRSGRKKSCERNRKKNFSSVIKKKNYIRFD